VARTSTKQTSTTFGLGKSTHINQEKVNFSYNFLLLKLLFYPGTALT